MKWFRSVGIALVATTTSVSLVACGGDEQKGCREGEGTQKVLIDCETSSKVTSPANTTTRTSTSKNSTTTVAPTTTTVAPATTAPTTTTTPMPTPSPITVYVPPPVTVYLTTPQSTVPPTQSSTQASTSDQSKGPLYMSVGGPDLCGGLRIDESGNGTILDGQTIATFYPKSASSPAGFSLNVWPSIPITRAIVTYDGDGQTSYTGKQLLTGASMRDYLDFFLADSSENPDGFVLCTS